MIRIRNNSVFQLDSFELHTQLDSVVNSTFEIGTDTICVAYSFYLFVIELWNHRKKTRFNFIEFWKKKKQIPSLFPFAFSYRSAIEG